MSPIFYIVVSQGLVYTTFSWIMFHVWRKNDRQPHILIWAIGFLFGAFGWLINLIPTRLFPSDALFWLADNLITLVSASTVCYGFIVRGKRSLHFVWFILAAFITLNFVAYFSSVYDNFALKMAISPWYVVFCLQTIAVIIWRTKRPLSAAEKVTAWVCEVGAIVHLVRGFLTAWQATGSDPQLQFLYEMFSYMLLPAAYTAIGISLLLIIISDLSERMNELSITDDLTGVLNARGITRIANKLLAHCERSDQCFSLILANVDHLQSINQQYGHHAGDNVLKAFADALVKNLRQGDYVGRTDGEEFVLLLPNTDDDGAVHMAERIRLEIGQMMLKERDQEIRFTASFGLASTRREFYLDKLQARAEHALYQAKLGGRNRVVTPSFA